MISLAILEKRGISAKLLKPKLEIKAAEEQDPKLASLRSRIRSRVQNGRNGNIANHQLYYALDRAWDVPFQQTTITLVQSLIDKDPADKSVLDNLNAWGLNQNDVFKTVTEWDQKTGKNVDKSVLDIPAFYKVFVPLCRAYLTIRLAKIMNDRHREPFLKYEPAYSNVLSRLRCDVITSRVEMVSRQFGFWEVVKQSVFNMLQYGMAFQLPLEAWYRERQEAATEDGGTTGGDDDDVVSGIGITGEKKKRATKITKEGIRYHIPHPSRIFYDKAYRASTFNSDTGCEYLGYWRVLRWRDVADNKQFYNTDKISIGATDWWNSAVTFFNTVYSSCTLKFPIEWNMGDKDRETELANRFYTNDVEDRPVMLTEYFEKLIPSENGLGDYDGKVWFRFVIAAYDTIVYAEPLAYCPIIYYGYDCDENRSQNASLTLEVLPWQDQISNIMSQYIYTAKMNLANVTFVDEEMVGKNDLGMIRNLGAKLITGLNFITFKGREMMRRQQDPAKAFQTHRFEKQDTNVMLMALRTILDTVERVLQFSSQELGQAASHELRAGEVANIAQATSTRAKFTQIPVDEAIEAMKRQLYHALMAYGAPEFYAELPQPQELTPEELKAIGFTFDEDAAPALRTDKKIKVKVDKKELMYEEFTANRDGDDRVNNAQLAGAMLQALGPLLANPAIEQKIGDQVIGLLNEIFRMAGFPRDFQLLDKTGQGAPVMLQQVQQMLQQFQQQMAQQAQATLEPMAKGIEAVTEKVQQDEADSKAIAAKVIQMDNVLGRLTALIQQAQPSPSILPPNGTPQIPPGPSQPAQAQLVA